jgi:hypothetical protein
MVRSTPQPIRAPRASRWRVTLLVLWLPVSGAACTVIELRAGPDDVRIERRFGFATLDVHPQRDAVVARTRIFGVGRSPFGFSAGWSDSEIAALPPSDCRVVLWIEDRAQIEIFRTLIADVHDVCLVTPSDPTTAPTASTTPSH